MSKIKLDLSNVTDGFAPIPAGKYLARVDSVKEGVSKNEQPKLEVVFKIFAPPAMKGRLAWLNLSLQPQALWRVKQFLVACGVDKEDLKGITTVDPADMVGAEVTLTMRDSEWNGEARSEIAKIEPPVDIEDLEIVDSADPGFRSVLG